MTEVRKATAEDFEGILPLLLKFDTDVATWRKLFMNHWQNPENYFGFVLVDEGIIVGFLGAIFSTRMIHGQPEKFCNLSTWIVDEKYKKQGLSLFLPVLELEEYTVTNFSSAEKTYIISKKLGFEDIEPNLQYIFPAPSLKAGTGLSLTMDAALIRKNLTENDLKIYQDHAAFDCHHVVIKQGEEQCYLIIKKSKAWLKAVYYIDRIWKKVFRSGYIQEHAFVGQVHYVSNKYLFAKSIDALTYKICHKLKLVGLVANEQWMTGSKVYRRPYKTFSAPLFKSKTVHKEDIDSLYSEIFVINS